MARQWYSKRHYERLSNGAPDTPEIIAERIAYRAAAEQAHKEMLARFSPLTPERCICEAFPWQEQRIKELMRANQDREHAWSSNLAP